jgi:hypothetical protein
MKKQNIEGLLNDMPIPHPENLIQHHELKIPMLSYRKSSRAGLWLLLVPLTFAFTLLLKTELGIHPAFLDYYKKFLLPWTTIPF